MKKIITVLLSIILLFSLITPCFASTFQHSKAYTYTYADGTTVEYFLDENGYPYSIINGEKILLMIALPHLKITDEKLIKQLNNSISEQNPNTRTEPENTYSLKGGADDVSNMYVTYVDFSNVFFSPIFELNSNHHAMRIKTTNIEKPFLGSNKISFTYRYYSIENDAWYTISKSNVRCTDTYGYGFQIDASSFPYSQVVIYIPEDITSCDLAIWTTTAY